MDTLFKKTMARVRAKISEEGSIRSFAQRLDMNPTTISRWFAENRSPDFENLCIILEYFNARIVFPEDLPPKAPSPVEGEATPPHPKEPTNLSHQLAQARREISSLRKQLEAMRSERDMARGQSQALKEQIERLTPTPEKNQTSQLTQNGKLGITKQVVA